MPLIQIKKDFSRRFGVCQNCESLSTVDKTKKSKLEHHMAELAINANGAPEQIAMAQRTPFRPPSANGAIADTVSESAYHSAAPKTWLDMKRAFDWRGRWSEHRARATALAASA